MAQQALLTISGLNTFLSPFIRTDGELLRAINVVSYPYGAKTKRPGYVTNLGTPDNAQVNTIFSWTKDDGTTQFQYRASGSVLYYSLQGTTAWAPAVNGTIGNGAWVGHAILDNKMMICDGVGSTRYTTDGTTFINGTLAPVAVDAFQYGNRVYLLGTASNAFYSVTGDLTNWNTSGTSDSSSLTIPGAGKLSRGFKCADRAHFCKTSGEMYRWDDYALTDMSTEQGPTSPQSVASKEGYYMWLNNDGIQGYGGNRPEIISNAIQSQIYNNMGSGIAGTALRNAPGVVHRYDYLLSVGNVYDDIAGTTINNAIIKYDIQKNEFLNWSFYDKPTAWHSCTDTAGNRKLYFGNASGQCFVMSGTATTDNGQAITAVMEFCLHLGKPYIDKKWNELVAIFNPGCEAQIQVATSETYERASLKWSQMGEATNGIFRYRFDQGSRAKLCFVRITDSSKTAPFRFYGFGVDADLERM